MDMNKNFSYGSATGELYCRVRYYYSFINFCSMWIRINGSLVCTELPVMRQLAIIGAKIELTANDPFPTFLMEYNDHLWLFNATGGKVDTMAGSLSAIKFNHIADIRTLIPELDWKEV